jgi:acyl carrier protein
MDRGSMGGVREKLIAIFSKLLKKNISINENIVRSECSEWDSLKQVEIVFIVEDAFNINFSSEDLDKLISIDAFEHVIRKKI